MSSIFTECRLRGRVSPCRRVWWYSVGQKNTGPDAGNERGLYWCVRTDGAQTGCQERASRGKQTINDDMNDILVKIPSTIINKKKVTAIKVLSRYCAIYVWEDYGRLDFEVFMNSSNEFDEFGTDKIFQNAWKMGKSSDYIYIILCHNVLSRLKLQYLQSP